MLTETQVKTVLTYYRSNINSYLATALAEPVNKYLGDQLLKAAFVLQLTSHREKLSTPLMTAASTFGGDNPVSLPSMVLLFALQQLSAKTNVGMGIPTTSVAGSTVNYDYTQKENRTIAIYHPENYKTALSSIQALIIFHMLCYCYQVKDQYAWQKKNLSIAVSVITLVTVTNIEGDYTNYQLELSFTEIINLAIKTATQGKRLSYYLTLAKHATQHYLQQIIKEKMRIPVST